MSVVSNRHNVIPFISGKSIALDGQRLTVAKYKSTEKQKAKYPNVCASIPVMKISKDDITDSLMVHINEWLQLQQDNVFKSVYESKGGTLASIGDEELNIGAIVGYLNASASSGRLTKEAIESWYKEEMIMIIMINAGVKKGFINANDPDISRLSAAQSAELDKVCNVYRDLFSGLAGGSTRYDAMKQDSLKRMLAQATESPMAERLFNRLESMKEPESIVDIL